VQGYNPVTYFEEGTYQIQSAGKAWSYQSDGNKMRFELHPGDHWQNDTSPVERSEIGSSKKLEFGQTYTINYKFMIEPGQPNTAGWLVIGQLHATEDPEDLGTSPPFEITLVKERMEINVRWSDNPIISSHIAPTHVYTDTQNIERGRWYDIKITVKFDPFGEGLLNVWRDGVQVVHYTGGLGYNDQVGPYWKHGVYRKPSAETIVANYSDFSLVKGTASDHPTTPNNPTNAAPDHISLSQSSVLELALNGTTIGDLSAHDPNGSDSLTFTLLNNAGGRFALDATKTKLIVLDGSKIDYEQAATHTVIVRVTDQGGLFHDQSLTINVQNVAPETSRGSAGNDILVGGKGTDVFKSGSGRDHLTGSLGADKLWGGKGADVFAYRSVKDSTVSAKGRDVIYDFSTKQKDKIDLKSIDADTKKKGNQAFSFIGEEDFHHKAGELRTEAIKGGLLVSADTNGNGQADFALFVKGLSSLSKGYFVL
jgi:Ca2+-binding RTX toxin-like protein